MARLKINRQDVVRPNAKRPNQLLHRRMSGTVGVEPAHVVQGRKLGLGDNCVAFGPGAFEGRPDDEGDNVRLSVLERIKRLNHGCSTDFFDQTSRGGGEGGEEANGTAHKRQ